ncbi:HD-GYP domain-containing protein [Virgibacillus sediminis]|uniref:HD-GYP domain-containing protein n=1 Tax=Virgibacillus sediminis TaxID=202260 RepID=A0ABV7A784_9BACI
MRVAVEQLVSGCVVKEDVEGKSGKPIIPRNTVLNDELIEVLRSFLIDMVEVGSLLADGGNFHPQTQVGEMVSEEKLPVGEDSLSFQDHYRLVAAGWQKLLAEWKSGVPIDIDYIGKLVSPLLRRTEGMKGQSALSHLELWENKNLSYFHSVSLAVLASLVAKNAGFPQQHWMQIGLAGFLAECGKAKLPAGHDLSKAQELPVISYRMLREDDAIGTDVKLAVLQYQERNDGTGYPLGLTAEKIHKYAKVLAVCDMFISMVQERTPIYHAMEYIDQHKYSLFDYQAAEAFIETVLPYSIGSQVQLSDGRKGTIVFIDTNSSLRPVVQLSPDNIINLQVYTSLHIAKTLDL